MLTPAYIKFLNRPHKILFCPKRTILGPLCPQYTLYSVYNILSATSIYCNIALNWDMFLARNNSQSLMLGQVVANLLVISDKF